jgi:DNA-3-methyladenine glycosylase II
MYVEHLHKDKKLRLIIEEALEPIPKKNNIAILLMHSIMSQQLSTKVADILKQRFTLLCKGAVTVEKVALLQVEALRAIGLSNQKAQYILNVAQFFKTQKLTAAQLHQLPNEALINLLTQIKGVGKWTVEMLLMFGMAREDVFSSGDYGIQQAMIKLYNLQSLSKKECLLKMEQIALKWSPYRTYACRHLWNYKDDK